MGPAKIVALAAALWSGVDAMRVRKEAEMMEKLIELAKEAESLVNEEEKVALENKEVAEVKSASGDRRRRRRRRTLGFLTDPFESILPGTGSPFPVMVTDRNPIGKGTIPAAYGLIVQIFGGSNGLRISDLRQIVVDRVFPDGYSFPGGLQSRAGRPSRSSLPHSMDGNANIRRGKYPFEFEEASFVEADLRNVNFIICPFLSTMMWEGGIELKQVHTEEELMAQTIKAGLDHETAEEHVQDNFANNPDGTIDLWNLEGVMNEHVSSTGINDCSTSFTNCRNFGNRRARGSEGDVCDAFTDRSCTLPNVEIFDEFAGTVDDDNDGFVTTEELAMVAARGCRGLDCDKGQ